jgi:hypothetical protein
MISFKDLVEVLRWASQGKDINVEDLCKRLPDYIGYSRKIGIIPLDKEIVDKV